MRSLQIWPLLFLSSCGSGHDSQITDASGPPADVAHDGPTTDGTSATPDSASATPDGASSDTSTGAWSPCEACSFGTQIISDESALLIKNLDQYQKGYVFTGSPYNAVDIDPDPNIDFGYENLAGWQRGFVEGTMDRLQNKPGAASGAGLGDHYEYLAYGPESAHQAGDEALWPDVNVPKVKDWAAAAGKQLMYAPSREDYETNIPAARPSVNPQHLIADVAQHVDIWGLQLGYLQGQVDDGELSESEFAAWLDQWGNWIRVGDPAAGHPGNPATRMVVQMGIAKYDAKQGTCLPPEPVEYILRWRERVASVVDGIIVMPSQRCQPCPPDPPAGFICTTDPNFIANYRRSFDNTLAAAAIVCPK